MNGPEDVRQLIASGKVGDIARRLLTPIASALMMTSFICAPAFAATSTQEGGVQALAPVGDIYSRFRFEWQNRKYLVHVPPDYDGVRKLPLVLCLHGGGGDIGFARRMFRLNEKADKEGFIVVYPNGSGRLGDHFLTWNANLCCGFAEAHRVDDVAFLRSFLDSIDKEYNIDPKRTYLVGFSNGAMMAYRLATEMPERFAAVAVVSGSMCGLEKEPAEPVPMLIIHGTKDRHIPIQGGAGKLAKWGFNVHAKPLQYAVDFWVNADGCTDRPAVEHIGKIVERQQYSGGKQGSEVIVYTIDGYAHSWPGGNRAWLLADTPAPAPALSATDACWDFFAHHTR